MVNHVKKVMNLMGILFFILAACMIYTFTTSNEIVLAEPDSGAAGEKAYDTDELKPQLVLQSGHTNFVNTIDFSPDGRYIASGGADDTIRLWDSKTGNLIKTIGCDSGVSTVKFLPDGRYLASANTDIRIWDTRTSKCVKTLKGLKPDEFVYYLAAPPNGNFLISVSHSSDNWSSSAQVWDLNQGLIVKTFKAQSDVEWLSVSSAGSFMIVHRPGSIKIIDPFTGNTIHHLKASTGVWWERMLRPCDSILASFYFQSKKHLLKLWDILSGRLIKDIPIPDTVSYPINLCGGFSSDGRYFAYGEKFGGLKIFDVQKGSLLKETATYSVNSMAFSPDSSLIAAGTGLVRLSSAQLGNYIEIRKLPSCECIKKMEPHSFAINSIGLSHEWTDILMTLSKSANSVKKWNVESGHINNYALKQIPGEIPSGTPSGDGSLFADTSVITINKGLQWQTVIRIFETQAGNCIQSIKYPGKVTSLSFSDNCKKIAIVGMTLAKFDAPSGNVNVYKVSDGTLTKSLKVRSSYVGSLKFSRNDKYIAAKGSDGKVFIWDMTTGSCMNNINTDSETARANDIQFSPDDRYLVSFTYKNKKCALVIWDWKSGKFIKSFNEGIESGSCSFSSDGRFLAMTFGNSTIRIWDIVEDRFLTSLSGHSGFVTSLVFSEDNRFLLSSSWDTSLKLWDIRKSHLVSTMIPFSDNDWVAYTPEGYFDCSEGGKKYIGWTVGMKHYPAERFFDEFYTPGLISSVIKGETLSKRHDLREGFMLPPDVTITSPKSREKVKGDTVEVVVEAKDIGGGIEDVRLYHQGKLLSVPRGTEKTSEGDGKTRLVRYSVRLLDGENVLQATAYNRDHTVESNPFEVIIRCDVAPKKAKAYVLAVGINSYKDTRLTLKNSRQDAEALVECLKKKGASLFSFQDISALCDEKATRENIMKALEGFSDKANPEDVVILYFSGHGDISPVDGEYYFLPYEFDMKGKIEEIYKDKGISRTSIGQLSREIKARKQVIILDTCHAEGALQAFRSPAEIKAYVMLAKSWGIHVLAATREGQMGSEVEALGHGLFTYAILEGLNGKADTDKEGIVTVRSLMHYVENEVEVLSEKYMRVRQSPVTDSRGMDFPLVVK